MACMCLFEIGFSADILPGVGLPDHLVALDLVFKGTSILFFTVALNQFPFSPTAEQGSLFSTPSPTFIVCRHFDDGHSDWCDVIARCHFHFHFSDN